MKMTVSVILDDGYYSGDGLLFMGRVIMVTWKK